jgi:signal transduction histidine kinase
MIKEHKTLNFRQDVQFTNSASALAHEVRNPLTNINLSLAMLGNEIRDPHVQCYLDIILRSSERINELVVKLLELEKGRETQAASCSVTGLLDEVLLMIRDRIQLKDISVSKLYKAPDLHVELNRTNMFLALSNILINGIEAMNSGSKELVLSTKLVGKKLELEIRDTGCGMSQESLDRIFDPNFSQRDGGLGKGLSTAYHILQMNHVKIRVESELGIGTRFFLLFSVFHPKKLNHQARV